MLNLPWQAMTGLLRLVQLLMQLYKPLLHVLVPVIVMGQAVDHDITGIPSGSIFRT